MTPEDFVRFFREERASAILRTPHGDRAVPAMQAAARAGFRALEFTLTIPNALEAIATLSANSEVVVGAGTVLTVEQAREAVAAGARFLVSPVCDVEVIEVAAELGVAIMPGCFTPTEMLRAHRAGAPLVKLFPSPGTGPSFVRACLGPLPFLKIVPTSGVTGENAAEYLAAGAHAVGFVAPLFHPSDIESEQYGKIEERGRALLAATRGQ